MAPFLTMAILDLGLDESSEFLVSCPSAPVALMDPSLYNNDVAGKPVDVHPHSVVDDEFKLFKGVFVALFFGQPCGLPPEPLC